MDDRGGGRRNMGLEATSLMDCSLHELHHDTMYMFSDIPTYFFLL